MSLASAAVIGNGQLGRALRQCLEDRGAAVRMIDRSELDLAELGRIGVSLEELLDAEEVLFLTAALTDVDACETRRDEALKVNATAPGIVAREMDEKNTRIVFFSSDYVFGNGHSEPIPPEAEPSPLSVYGLSKRAGELAVRSHHPNPLIVRSSGLFGPGENFVTAIAGRLADGEPVEVVDDQETRLCSVEYLAETSVQLVENESDGIWHVALRGAGSWFDHARETAAALGVDRDMVKPIKSSELARAAQRPEYSVLDISRTEQRLGEAPALPGALEKYLRSREQTPGKREKV